MDLKFLGVGSAFNFNEHNTSAYFLSEDKKSLFLIDCGESIFNVMLKKKLLDNVNNIYVFITHLHGDHVASLESLIYYTCLFTNKNLTIFYHARENLKKLMQLMGINFNFVIEDYPTQIDEFKIEYVEQKHIENSYGLFFFGKQNFFYSGDASTFNLRALEMLKSGEIDVIYHEVASKQSGFHISLESIEEQVQKNLRSKVTLMHFENEELKQKAKALGFNVAKAI